MPEVVMYSTEYCPFCIRAKNLLKEKKVEFKDIRIDQEPHRRAEMIEKSGRRTVPQIWINGQHIGGSDDLMNLEHQNRLDELLKQEI